MFHPDKAWSRRKFLKAVGGVGLISAVPSLARAVDTLKADTVRISILHTTDLHGHILPTEDYAGRADLGGFARCATQIRRWRNENVNSIVIDVGDVYQGTDVALRSKGELMIDLFNLLNYDAWIVGNHEFDWGIDPFLSALTRSRMPVLAANSLLEGKMPGDFADTKHPLAKIRPYLLKEIAGIKIAIIGITTPGMPFWFRPDFTRGFDAQYPIEFVRAAIKQAQSEGAHTIVLAGHMGFKERSGGDDFANCVMALTAEFPETAAFIAGHTHRDIPSRMTNGVVVTQADHFGIFAGCLDLIFDRDSKKFLQAKARIELMDNRFEFDPAVMSRAHAELDASEAMLSQPVGELAETLSVRTRAGEPSDVEMLIGAAVAEALAARNVQVDGVLHGLFDEKNRFVAGTKTIGEIWNVLPYENFLVTGEFTAEEISIFMNEVFASHEPRNLMGFDLELSGARNDRRIINLRLNDGRPLRRDARYRIAFNTFDACSGGHRFMKLRGMLGSPVTCCAFHPVQTRDALIDYFRQHKVVHRLPRPRELKAAA